MDFVRAQREDAALGNVHLEDVRQCGSVVNSLVIVLSWWIL